MTLARSTTSWSQRRGYSKPVSVAAVREIAGLCSASHAKPTVILFNGLTPSLLRSKLRSSPCKSWMHPTWPDLPGAKSQRARLIVELYRIVVIAQIFRTIWMNSVELQDARGSESL